MLSAKFKVSFVKLSLEIRHILKDILHNTVTSNLIIITYQNQSTKKMKKKFAVPVLEKMCFFFLLFHCLFHISADIKRHQIMWNRPWFSSDVKRVAGTLPSEDTRQNALWGWLRLRKCLTFFTHITHCLLTPFSYTGEKKWSCFEWVSNQTPRVTLIFTTMQIQDVMVSMLRSQGREGIFQPEVCEGSVVLLQYCKYTHWQFYYM